MPASNGGLQFPTDKRRGGPAWPTPPLMVRLPVDVHLRRGDVDHGAGLSPSGFDGTVTSSWIMITLMPDAVCTTRCSHSVPIPDSGTLVFAGTLSPIPGCPVTDRPAKEEVSPNEAQAAGGVAHVDLGPGIGHRRGDGHHHVDADDRQVRRDRSDTRGLLVEQYVTDARQCDLGVRRGPAADGDPGHGQAGELGPGRADGQGPGGVAAARGAHRGHGAGRHQAAQQAGRLHVA
jgi:hypothetical protein